MAPIEWPFLEEEKLDCLELIRYIVLCIAFTMPFDVKNKKHVGILVGVIAAILLIGVIVLVVVLLYKTDAEGDAGNEYQNQGRELHNEYRKKHHVDPLKLNKELNDLAVQCAQYYAKKGTIDHSCPTKTRADGSKAGENLFMSSASNMEDVKAAEQATTKWYEEVKLYNFDANSPSNFAQVGHFTQLVWKDSKELGVGVAKGSGTVCVALYSPHGNNGKYKENVLPP